MNCPQCGAQVEAGWAHCSCGQYLPRNRPDTDMPSEFYSRLEDQVEKSGKDNFRRGLLLGLGFLALFLLLETAVDTSDYAGPLLIFLALVAIVGLSTFNIWLFVRGRKK